MKKKLLSVALATIMAMSLSATAFAEGEITDPSLDASGNYVKEVSVGVTKNVTNGTGISVEETYKFTVTEVSATNTSSSVTISDWAIDDFEITVDAKGTSASTSITLPEYTSVGIYTYTIDETDGKTLGVTYDQSVYTMVVTVINQNGVLTPVVKILDKDGDKVDDSGSGISEFSFTNTYTASNLTVAKELSGNFADPTKEFTFTITFTNGTEKDWKNAIEATGATVDSENANKYTINLKGGDDFTFSNIPEGLTYTVTESDYSADEYTAYIGSVAEENKGSEVTGEMTSSGANVTIVNQKGTTPDTGINLDSLPYVMILAVVVLGAAYVILKKRISDRY